MLYYTRAFYITMVSIYVPCKTLLFSVHNWLTNRDYSYSIDDLCDLMLLAIVSYWLHLYNTWVSEAMSSGHYPLVQSTE